MAKPEAGIVPQNEALTPQSQTLSVENETAEDRESRIDAFVKAVRELEPLPIWELEETYPQPA
jgi:hypothetical protein